MLSIGTMRTTAFVLLLLALTGNSFAAPQTPQVESRVSFRINSPAITFRGLLFLNTDTSSTTAVVYVFTIQIVTDNVTGDRSRAGTMSGNITSTYDRSLSSSTSEISSTSSTA